MYFKQLRMLNNTPFFKTLNDEVATSYDLVGALGVTVIPLLKGDLGQVKVKKDKGSFLINVRTQHEEKIQKQFHWNRLTKLLKKMVFNISQLLLISEKC